MKLTIGIKALNEDKHIAASLDSAVNAARANDGQVVLADSGSTDKTIDIARTYPVRILQLSNPNERSCGAGAQLAFQTVDSAYFYMLDGDMVLSPGFIEKGIAFLEAHPDYAGVGGMVVERNTTNQEFKLREATVRREKNWLPGDVERLDCGGLYRVSAIRQAGYFADRNLHAFEEFELASRLRANGWKLARIDAHAIDHYGHTTGGFKLLWRRIRSGYSGAPGEVLRAALGKSHFGVVISRLSHIRVGVMVWLWWAALISSLFAPYRPWPTLALIVAPLLFLWLRRGSLGLGAYSMAAWNVSALGLLLGLFRRRVNPTTPLRTKELTAKVADVNEPPKLAG